MFGEKLRNARKKKGLTLDQLADLYIKKFGGGLNKGTLSKYENNKQEPMITVVGNLSTILGVTVDYLIDEDEFKYNKTETPSLEKQELNEYLEELRTRPEMKMLFNLTKNATKNEVETAVKIIEALLRNE